MTALRRRDGGGHANRRRFHKAHRHPPDASVPARKRFGQHFLEAPWVEKVLRVVDPRPDEVFLEIGPGRGALTRPLAARAAHVIAFEIDRDLAAALRSDPPPRFTLIEGDFLDVNADVVGRALAQAHASGPAARVRVAGNLPYNVASPILSRLLDLFAAGIPLVDATVMVQREVADRLAARPGSKDYGVLSIVIQQRASVERLLALPPGAFRPAPKVHSAIVRLRFHPPDPAPASQDLFVRLTQAIFSRRRKTLANALRAFEPAARLAPAEALAQAGIDGIRRPETLTLGEIGRLSDAFSRAVL